MAPLLHSAAVITSAVGACSSAVTDRPCDTIYQLRSCETRMWANAQRDGGPAEHRWRPLFNAAKFG